MEDLVSVIIPVYNNATYITEAIRSVIRQTHGRLEIIVVDDGSIDRTGEMIRAIEEPRLRYVRQSNSGPATARNRGILESRGAYIAFLDSDDIWMERKLERQLSALRSCSSEYALAYTDYYSGETSAAPMTSVLDAYSQKGSGDVLQGLLAQNFINSSTVVLRKEILARAGLFDSTLRGGEDRHLWLRIAADYKFYFVDEILAFRRFHPENTSRSEAYFESCAHVWTILQSDSRFRSHSSAVAQGRRKHLRMLADHYYDVQHKYLKAARVYATLARGRGERGYLVLKTLYCLWLHYLGGRQKHGRAGLEKGVE